jgi:hypothetical protein
VVSRPPGHSRGFQLRMQHQRVFLARRERVFMAHTGHSQTPSAGRYHLSCPERSDTIRNGGTPSAGGIQRRVCGQPFPGIFVVLTCRCARV